MMLKEFAYILAVYEEGSISRAAKKLFMSQPGLSQYIRSLETSLGVPLIEFQDNKLVFTSAGLKYVELARQMVVMTNGLEEKLAKTSLSPYGTVHFGISSFWSSSLLPSILTHFNTHYPNISLVFENDSEENLIDRLLKNRLRFALVNLPISSKKLDYFPLFEEEVRFIASKDNKIIRKYYANSTENEVVDFRHFRNEPFIFLNKAPNLCIRLKKLCASAGYTPQKTVNSDTVCLVRKLCFLNYGVSALPSILIDRFVDNYNLKLLSLQNPKYTMQLVVTYNKDTSLSQAENLFVQALTKISYNIHSNMFEIEDKL